MFNVLYWTALSIVIVLLSHNVYAHVYTSPSREVCQHTDHNDSAMREELTAYINTIEK